MRVLFLTGTRPVDDAAAMDRLAQASTDLQITLIDSPATALAEVRRSREFHVLLVSPTVPQTDALALIVSLRRDSVPIAIAPIVTETQQSFYASAVASGADDVLLLRGDQFVNLHETLGRIRQSRHLQSGAGRRRLRVLYAGRDPVVSGLLEQIPFVAAERATVSDDGVTPIRVPGAADSALRCDAVVVDEPGGAAHPLQVLKSVKAQASDVAVVMLTAPAAGDVETAALDLGADDIVVKSGVFRRRLVATLRHVHQRIELVELHTALQARAERLRQILERLPAGLAIISADGSVLAINAEAQGLVGASKPTDVVGRPFISLVLDEHRVDVTDALRGIIDGQPSEVQFDVVGLDGARRPVHLHGVLLERDARGSRGVIAVLRLPDPAANAAAQSEAAFAELETAKQALEEAEDRHREVADLLAVERAAIEPVRQQLEMRLNELAEATADRTRLERELDAARQELQQAADAHTWERTSWENTRRELHAKLQEVQQAAEAGAAAEATAGGLTEDLRKVTATLEWERAAWETERRRLGERIEAFESAVAAHTRVEAALESATATLQQAQTAHAGELRQAAEALAAERDRADQTRQELTGRFSELERALADRSAIDATLAAVRTELQAAVDAHAGERGQWEEHRAGLAARIDELERGLDQANTSYSDDRQRWETTRRELASRVEALDALAERHPSVEAALAAASHDASRAATDHSAERATWEQARTALSARVHELEALVHEHGRVDGALESAQHELGDAKDAHGRERAHWNDERRQLQDRLRELEAAATERPTASALEAARGDLREATNTLAWERAQSETARRQHEHQLRALEEARAADRRELETERQQAESRLADLQRQFDAARAARAEIELTLEDTRQAAARSVNTLAAEQAAALRSRDDEHRVTIERLTSELAALQSDRARLGAELASTDTSQRWLLECGLVGLSVMTLDGRLMRCNDAFARMFGYADADDAIVRTDGQPFPGTAGRAELDATLLERRQLPYVDSCLERIDGRPLRVIESATLITADVDGAPLVERVLVEMNLRSELEERLQQARRLEEVGRLAAAITPDIDSLISSIHDPGARLSKDSGVPDEARRHADVIVARAKRATDLVRQLLRFSVKQGRPPAPIDVNDVVQRMQPILSRLIGSHVAFDVELGRTDAVLASDDDLEQLVTTLVVSVRDLLPVGGSLRLETAAGRLDWATDGGTDARSGPAITLAVTAAGYGAQVPQPTAPLALLAQRCGGSLDVLHHEGRVGLQVHIPYFSRSARANASTRLQ